MKVTPHSLTVATTLLLLMIASAAQDCAKADSIECDSQLCRGHSYTNYTCVANTTHNACTTGQNYYNGACVTCASGGTDNCSVICPDYV